MGPDILPYLILKQAFPGISDQEAREMTDRGTVKMYPAGTVPCREGAQEDIFYILLSGKARVTKSVEGTDSRLIKSLYPGDFFGEMALFYNSERAASVTTDLESTALQITHEIFSSLMIRSSPMSLGLV